MNYIETILEMLYTYKDLYVSGTMITLLISLTGTIMGLLIGLILAFFRDENLFKKNNIISKFLRVFSNVYVEVLRGTPMIVQSVFIYYGLYKYLLWSPISAGIFIVSINTASYMAEILRGAIQSIDNGQREAGLSIGMTNTQIYRYIILPQALKNSIPNIGNEFVVNIKDTSVLNVIALSELFFQGMSVAGSTFDYSKSMLIIAIIYFILTFSVTRILKLIEVRMNLVNIRV